jgi:hypothetical protein
MHVEEAHWINRILERIPAEELTPVLNMGSSTADFRLREQPHIDRFVFAPLRKRGVRVVNQDIKEAAGVDVVGNLMDPRFVEKLRAMQFRTLLCNNLLQHVPDPKVLMRRVFDLLPIGALLVVTGPSAYPKHLDPIDTMFRPSPDEILRLFGDVQIVEMQEMNVGTILSSYVHHPLGFARLVLRASVPFIRHAGWVTAVNKLTWLLRTRKLYLVALRKS